MLIILKFLDSLGECKFEVGYDVGLNIVNLVFKIFAKCIHCIEAHIVNAGGEFRYHIIFRHDYQRLW